MMMFRLEDLHILGRKAELAWTIGAVFDFFAGTVERAPIWWQEHGLEWLYRLLKEPKRMWRRYIIGNSLFLWNMVKEQ